MFLLTPTVYHKVITFPSAVTFVGLDKYFIAAFISLFFFLYRNYWLSATALPLQVQSSGARLQIAWKSIMKKISHIFLSDANKTATWTARMEKKVERF